MHQLAELAIGRRDRIEPAIQQRVGNAGLLLHARRERHEGRRGRADVEDQVGLERQHDFEIGGVAAAGDAADLGPGADIRQHVDAFFRPVGARPAEQQIGRQRIEQDRGRRPCGKHASDLLRHRHGAARRVGDGRGAAGARRKQRSRAAQHQRPPVKLHRLPHRFVPRTEILRGSVPPAFRGFPSADSRPRKRRLRRLHRRPLDGAIVADQFGAEPRQNRSAALRAAGLGIDHRMAEAPVHVVDQQPGPAIGHAERPACLRNRAGGANGFEQADLAGPDRPARAEIDPQCQFGVGHGVRSHSEAGRYLRTGVFRSAPMLPPVMRPARWRWGRTAAARRSCSRRSPSGPPATPASRRMPGRNPSSRAHASPGSPGSRRTG